MDLVIAATALANRLALLTAKAEDFDHLIGLIQVAARNPSAGLPAPASPARLEPGLQPVDDPRDLRPVLAFERVDEIAQRLRLERRQRLSAGRGLAHERVTNQGVGRGAGAAGEVVKRWHGVGDDLRLDLARELSVPTRDCHARTIA